MAKVNFLLPAVAIDGYLIKALESLQAQIYRDFSVILVLNSSLPPTPSDLERVRLACGRTTVIHHAEPGISQALNAGLAACDGVYIARMDGDDICVPERLKRQVDFLEREHGVAAVGCTARLIDKDGLPRGRLKTTKIRTLREMRATLRFENPYIHPSVMIRANVLKEHRYDPVMIGCQDWDLWIRLSLAGQLIVNMDEDLLLYRVHSKQDSQSQDRSRFVMPLRRCLARLDPALLVQYQFQRPYLSSEPLGVWTALKLIVREFPNVMNVFSARKFMSALVRSLRKV